MDDPHSHGTGVVVQRLDLHGLEDMEEHGDLPMAMDGHGEIIFFFFSFFFFLFLFLVMFSLGL